MLLPQLLGLRQLLVAALRSRAGDAKIKVGNIEEDIADRLDFNARQGTRNIWKHDELRPAVRHAGGEHDWEGDAAIGG